MFKKYFAGLFMLTLFVVPLTVVNATTSLNDIDIKLDYFTNHHNSEIDILLKKILILTISFFGSPCGAEGSVYNYQTGQLCSINDNNTQISVIHPAGGETFTINSTAYGANLDVKWKTANIPSVGTVNLELRDALTGTVIQRNTGVKNTGYYSMVAGHGTPTGKYVILIDTNINGIAYSGKSGVFYIQNNVGGAGNNGIPKITGFPSLPETIQVGQVVSFNYTATDPDGNNLGWSGSWGDGSGFSDSCPPADPETTFNTTHTWYNPGVNYAYIKVFDCLGGSDIHTFSVPVGVGGGGTTTPVISSIKLITPATGANHLVGSQQSITWTSTNVPATNFVTMKYLTLTGSALYVPVAQSPNDGLQVITVPNLPAGQYYFELDAQTVNGVDVLAAKKLINITHNLAYPTSSADPNLQYASTISAIQNLIEALKMRVNASQ